MTMTMAMSAEMKALYKAALEQAALGDLQFTLRIAEQRMAEYEMPSETIEILRQMRQRERQLAGVKGTKAMQAESLRLLTAYRASIPGYCVYGTGKLVKRDEPLSLADVTFALDYGAEPVPVKAKRTASARAQKTVAPAMSVCTCPNCGHSLVSVTSQAA